MKVSALYTYPIKSLRGAPLTEAIVTRSGFQHDRRFMLLKVIREDDGTETLKNMHVPHFPEMALFRTDIVFPTDDHPGRIIVTYRPPGTVDDDDDDDDDDESETVKMLEIPLQPDVRGLKKLGIVMHSSPTKGYDMGSAYNDWFSECFKYPVVLAYLGRHSRPVLGTFAPGKNVAHRDRVASSSPVVSTRTLAVLGVMTLALTAVRVGPVSSADTVLTPVIVSLAAVLGAALLSTVVVRGWVSSRIWRGAAGEEEKISFADAAPYMVASKTSLENVSARLSCDEEVDMTKFRPNIVVSGAETAFEEDFWAELAINDDIRLLLTANCVRCQSINVDYVTGKMGKGEMGNVFKKLMKDRRVDKGAKFSPVFGRYSFLEPDSDQAWVRVGDEVEVSRWMVERAIYDWPGLS